MAGLGNLLLRDTSDPSQRLPESPVLDLAITNDALHDMARPDLAMAAVRKVCTGVRVLSIGLRQCSCEVHVCLGEGLHPLFARPATET